MLIKNKVWAIAESFLENAEAESDYLKVFLE
jgi:hypothetical protein